jgi:hypothetical protein
MSPGPPPRYPEWRHRRRPPGGGEWVDLEPIDKPILAPLPRRSKADGPWSARARATWNAWRQDPATRQWTASDSALALETLYLLEQSEREPRASLAAEVRLRMDALGLTATGKRRLRWRLRAEGEVLDFAPKPRSNTRRLRAVDPEGA